MTPGVPAGPTVSVVIPAYNAERYLAETIASVLGQTWADLECIVVDDGSTDGTSDLLRTIEDPRVRVITKENRGTVSDARNAGLDVATGTFVAFLDADDIWLPTKLARQLAVFDTGEADLALVYTAYGITDEHLQLRSVIWPRQIGTSFDRWLLLEGNGIATSSTALVRNDAIERAGRFRLELSVSEDVDYAERVSRLGAVDYVDECLVLYRAHPGQGHRRLDAYEHDMTWIFDDRFGPLGAIDRRRWRRGTANLHTRLLFYALRDGRLTDARRHAAVALTTGPTRIAALPIEALLRAAQRRRITAARQPSVDPVTRFVATLRSAP